MECDAYIPSKLLIRSSVVVDIPCAPSGISHEKTFLLVGNHALVQIFNKEIPHARLRFAIFIIFSGEYGLRGNTLDL